jgi:hypothetical protein
MTQFFHDLMSDNSVIGLLIGFGTGGATGFASGFYFERRANKRDQQVSEELDKIETNVRYGFSGPPEPLTEPQMQSLAQGVYERARRTQNENGLVDREELVAYFKREGHCQDNVNAAIASLRESGQLHEHGDWVKL